LQLLSAACGSFLPVLNPSVVIPGLRASICCALLHGSLCVYVCIVLIYSAAKLQVCLQKTYFTLHQLQTFCLIRKWPTQQLNLFICIVIIINSAQPARAAASLQHRNDDELHFSALQRRDDWTPLHSWFSHLFFRRPGPKFTDNLKTIFGLRTILWQLANSQNTYDNLKTKYDDHLLDVLRQLGSNSQIGLLLS